MADLKGNRETNLPSSTPVFRTSSKLDLTDFRNNIATENKTFTGDDIVNIIGGAVSYSPTGLKSAPESPTIQTLAMDGVGNGSVSPSTYRRAYVVVAILFLINLLNYMDRFTIAGVLTAVRDDFVINDAKSGLLQTVFVCTYMVFAPVFGFLGDRYSRKWIMIVGIFIWSATVLLSTFVPSNMFVVFLLCRGVVGIGEASYSTVASTLIADLFTKDMRSRMLMVFYFAIPVGSGLGFMVGSGVASLFTDPKVGWRWGVRVTPIFGLVCLLLLIFLLEEPKRGEAEDVTQLRTSSWTADLAYLTRNRSFTWSTLAFTCVAFAAGSLSWWGPSFVAYAEQSEMKTPNTAQIGTVFGIITVVAGLLGVTIGSMSAQVWRRSNPKADPLVCGIGVLLCVPCLYLTLTFIRDSIIVSWVSVFFAVTCLSLNWAVVSDILLYVVPPNRRSTASAFQILFSHLLGDATSPYLIGQVSDAIRNGSESPADRFLGLKYAMYIPDFVLVLGGFFFLGTAWYVEADRKASELISKGLSPVENVAGQTPPLSNQYGSYGGVSDAVIGDLPTSDTRTYLISPDADSTSEAAVNYRL